MKKLITIFVAAITIGCTSHLWAEDSNVIYLEDIVVTASRMAQHGYKVSSNVSVIDRKKIEATNAKSIPEVLHQELGINIYDSGTHKTAIIDMRGFGDTANRNVLVLINDRKINSIDISGPDLSQIPLDSVERIEIIRGAGSVLYGDNAVGGIINIITKEGKGKLSGSATVTYGSYDARSQAVDISGSYKNAISYYIFSKYNDQRGYRQNSDLLSKDFNTRLGYEYSDNLSVDLIAGWHESDYGLPGGLNGTELEDLNRRESADPDDYVSMKDRFVQLVLDLKPWPEDIYFGSFTVDINYKNRDVYDSFNTYGQFDTKRAIDTTEIKTKYIFDRTLFNHDVNFVVGIDFFDSENDILGSGSNVDDITISKEEFGVFGYLQYELLNNIFVNGGVRYQKADYAFSQRNVAIDEKKSPHEWVSMGGMKYEYAKGSNIHFNVQETFRFLATDEWYSTANYPSWGITPGLNTDLNHQKGIQYEVGLKHNFSDITTINITPYRMDLKDEIFFDPVTFANSNYDKTRRIGLEVGQKTDLSKLIDLGFLNNFEIFTNYTFQDAKFVDGVNDKKVIPMTPKHQARIGINLEFLNKFSTSLACRYVGSRFAINDTLNVTSPIKPHTVLDAKFAYKLKNLELFTILNNITDEKYYSYVSKSTSSTVKDHFPAPEMNFVMGVKGKF